MDWSIKRAKSTCKGNKKIIISVKEADTPKRITDVAECARNCRGTSPIFFFGSGDGCSIHGCMCQCELVMYPDAYCEIMRTNHGDLYQFDKGKLEDYMNCIFK